MDSHVGIRLIRIHWHSFLYGHLRWMPSQKLNNVVDRYLRWRELPLPLNRFPEDRLYGFQRYSNRITVASLHSTVSIGDRFLRGIWPGHWQFHDYKLQSSQSNQWSKESTQKNESTYEIQRCVALKEVACWSARRGQCGLLKIGSFSEWFSY